MNRSDSRIENGLAKKSHFIILSPHLDDGVWSCGGLISHAVNSGCNTTVITVHSGNPTEKELSKLQRKELSKKGSIELRKKEDLAALKVLNANVIWWDLPTRLLRKPWLEKRSDVFKTPEGAELMNDDNYNKIIIHLTEIISNYPNALIICPMGVGHMYDHVELFTACINTGFQLNHLEKMLFYEDSYAILTGARKKHFILKDYIWNERNAPQSTTIWWRMMGYVMTKSASKSDITTCIPKELLNKKWLVDAIRISNQFDDKMESLSKYDSQMRQFGGMKRVIKAFKKYHKYWNDCEPFWYIEK